MASTFLSLKAPTYLKLKIFNMPSNIKFVVTPKDKAVYDQVINFNNENLPGMLADEVNSRLSPKRIPIKKELHCPYAPKKKLRAAYNASASVRTLNFDHPPPPPPPGGNGIVA
jgi:hypothetical protein